MKKHVLSFVALIALVGCSGKPELRKDIKEFISQFSLDDAVSEYVTGGYTSTKVTTIGESVTTEVVEMSYSLADQDHPTYTKTTTVNGEATVVTFVENEEGCFISTNGVLEPSSINECKGLITKFFYTDVQVNGTYHVGGWFYGDYLKEAAPWLQNYVTIDQENQLYIMEYTKSFKDDYGVDTTKTQKYSVNRYGMLVENHDLNENANKTVKQDIYVHN